MEANFIAKNRVIWEKCFSEQVCVKIPFDGTKCVGITACVRILEDGGSYYIELQLFGERRRFEIANLCYPVFELGVGRLKVCTSDLVIEGGKIKSIKILVEGCVGAKIGPIKVEKCWTLFDQIIAFFHLLPTERDINGTDPILVGYNDIAFIEKEIFVSKYS